MAQGTVVPFRFPVSAIIPTMKTDPRTKSRIKDAIVKWPHHKDHEIAKNLRNTSAAEVREVRESMGIPAPQARQHQAQAERPATPKTISLGNKTVLDHRPPESMLKFLSKIPQGKAEALTDFAKRIGRAPDRVRAEAKRLGCCKWVDRGNEDWELVVMSPETAQHYNE